MPAIFISHSSLDNDLTAEVAAWLRSMGYDDVFLDYDKDDGIAIGANWKGTLAAAMQRCHVVLLLISENWFASPWCQSEHGTATLRGKELLPVLVRRPEQECATAFTAKVLQHFGELQIADLTVDREGALHRLERAIGGSEPTPKAFPVPLGAPPYRGLVPYDTAARGLYFGRDVEVQAALERLRQLVSDGAGQVLVILGASGAGKSSMLRAGLWPHLQLRRHEFSPLDVVTLSRDPLGQRSMALAISDAVVGTLASANVRFDRDSLDGAIVSVGVGIDSRTALKTMIETEVARLRKLSGSSTSTVIFALDQAEVLLQAPMPEARSLCTALSVVLKIPNTLAVVTMRSDSFDQVLERRLLEGLELSVLPLPPLPISRLRDVIRGPARRVGIQVDGDLLDAMVAITGSFCACRARSRSLLQMARAVWEARQSTVQRTACRR